MLPRVRDELKEARARLTRVVSKLEVVERGDFGPELRFLPLYEQCISKAVSVSATRAQGSSPALDPRLTCLLWCVCVWLCVCGCVCVAACVAVHVCGWLCVSQSYEYRVCFFQSVSQDHTSLGKWEGAWAEPDVQAYTDGHSCWQNPARFVVTMWCACVCRGHGSRRCLVFWGDQIHVSAHPVRSTAGDSGGAGAAHVPLRGGRHCTRGLHRRRVGRRAAAAHAAGCVLRRASLGAACMCACCSPTLVTLARFGSVPACVCVCVAVCVLGVLCVAVVPVPV